MGKTITVIPGCIVKLNGFGQELARESQRVPRHILGGRWLILRSHPDDEGLYWIVPFSSGIHPQDLEAYFTPGGDFEFELEIVADEECEFHDAVCFAYEGYFRASMCFEPWKGDLVSEGIWQKALKHRNVKV